MVLLTSDRYHSNSSNPCYQGTAVEADARLLGRPVEWHGGFRVTTSDLRRHADYRAPEFAELGVSLARGGCLDPAMIGDASRAGRHDEQSLKRVWHYVARFGSDEMRAGHREAAAGKLPGRDAAVLPSRRAGITFPRGERTPRC